MNDKEKRWLLFGSRFRKLVVLWFACVWGTASLHAYGFDSAYVIAGVFTCIMIGFASLFNVLYMEYGD